jgi:hypothetical protein
LQRTAFHAAAQAEGPVALTEWTLAIEGEWYEDAYHGGSVSYLFRRHESGTWVFKSSERNTCLNDVTE